MSAINFNRQRSVGLCQILVSSVIIATVGACRIQECGLEPSTSPTNKRVEMDTVQNNEKQWAERLELSGVPNLYKVSEGLYRGAQPSAEGLRQLEKLGIKTVVNLRFILSDRGKIKGTGLDYEHINMTTLHVADKDVIRFLRIVTNPQRVPIFVHCQRGVERTGTMCAVYRIVVEGWSKEEAIEEMTKGGFACRNVQKNLVNYLCKLDINDIECRAGLNK